MPAAAKAAAEQKPVEYTPLNGSDGKPIDFVLQQALNQLKGIPVVSSPRALLASTAVTSKTGTQGGRKQEVAIRFCAGAGRHGAARETHESCVHVVPSETSVNEPPMDDQALLRYSRHILLNEFGIEAQQRLDDVHALVVGAGGLGSAALMYLASAGVGRITIADGDNVDLTNLQRQIVHREDSVGMNKAVSAARTLRGINSLIAIEARAGTIGRAGIGTTRSTSADVVLDCCDNFATRHAINRACVASRKPLVSGAGIRFDGQITTFDLREMTAPATTVCFPIRPTLKKSAARSWACLRRLWALSVRCRPPRRSDCCHGRGGAAGRQEC